jgi:hypothetical protein
MACVFIITLGFGSANIGSFTLAFANNRAVAVVCEVHDGSVNIHFQFSIARDVQNVGACCDVPL